MFSLIAGQWGALWVQPGAGQVVFIVSLRAPLNPLRPPRPAGQVGIIPGQGAAAWWVHKYQGLQLCHRPTSVVATGRDWGGS